ncbi:MAG: NAD-dependent deacylase [Deltaproteobacteria bacterium]|nr:NAD-dependent deacylase [Deltaproteobacteria bacterium]
MKKRRLIALTGAGISAESGLKTFRDHDGLWEGYSIEEVATPEAWRRNPQLVQRFYDERRKAVIESQPNGAHLALAQLEDRYRVTIITQNIDDLHERAGSTDVLHLHGQIRKAQSSLDPRLIYDIEGWQIPMGKKCEKGSQLRPHVVWFGEAVPMMEAAIDVAAQAEVFVVIGTSLVVYPAASLVEFVPRSSLKFLIDPKVPAGIEESGYRCFRTGAVDGCVRLIKELS